MEHAALMEVVDRLIHSGLNESEALLMVGRLLYEEAEDFIKVMNEIDSLKNPEEMN